MWRIRGTAGKKILEMQYTSGMRSLGSNPSFSAKSRKERKVQLFKVFKKAYKRANPANPTICRVYPFIPLFNIYKIAQNLCGAFVAHLEILKMCPKILS
ncbi:hypothetical protein EAH81_27375 [Flavobacterium pectinovorum]|uniref:Uncharacterized protein n=1 Tax=Flavobacterium pectinovorum TaxID=29533 RepID=A0A502DZS6_9FLAO|nr:hypothetical protein EAH81_27375 [Flavobacterium pectinovorum]